MNLSWIRSVLLLGQLLCWSIDTVNGAAADSCSAQNACITFTEETVDGTNPCFAGPDALPCVKKVCLNLFGSSVIAGCPDDTYSHVCDGADNLGCPYGNGFDSGDEASPVSGEFFSENKEVIDADATNVGSAAKMCQYGRPGDTLYFVLKDGNDSQDESGLTLPVENCDDIQCVRRDNVAVLAGTPAENGCGGGGNADKERVWIVTVCDCEAPSSTTTLQTMTTTTDPPPASTTTVAPPTSDPETTTTTTVESPTLEPPTASPPTEEVPEPTITTTTTTTTTTGVEPTATTTTTVASPTPEPSSFMSMSMSFQYDEEELTGMFGFAW